MHILDWDQLYNNNNNNNLYQILIIWYSTFEGLKNKRENIYNRLCFILYFIISIDFFQFTYILNIFNFCCAIYLIMILLAKIDLDLGFQMFLLDFISSFFFGSYLFKKKTKLFGMKWKIFFYIFISSDLYYCCYFIFQNFSYIPNVISILSNSICRCRHIIIWRIVLLVVFYKYDFLKFYCWFNILNWMLEMIWIVFLVKLSDITTSFHLSL